MYERRLGIVLRSGRDSTYVDPCFKCLTSSNKTEDFYQERSKEHQPEATYLDLA